MYYRFQLSIYYTKRDMDVEKRMKNAFFLFLALSHVFPSIYFYNTFIIAFMVPKSVFKNIYCKLILLTAR